MSAKFFIPLIVLSCCPTAFAEKVEVLAPGWPQRGTVEADSPDYLTFFGSGVVSGVVIRDWVDGMDVDEDTGSLTFQPDEKSRKKYPILHRYIDLGVTEENAAIVGLPFRITPDVSVCGYKVEATLFLGPYYKFNIGRSSGYDVVQVLAALDRGKTKEIICTSKDKRLGI